MDPPFSISTYEGDLLLVVGEDQSVRKFGDGLARCNSTDGSNYQDATTQNLSDVCHLLQVGSSQGIFSIQHNIHVPSCLLISYIEELGITLDYHSYALRQFVQNLCPMAPFDMRYVEHAVRLPHEWPQARTQEKDKLSILVGGYGCLRLKDNSVWFDFIHDGRQRAVYTDFASWEEIHTDVISAQDWYQCLWLRMSILVLSAVGIKPTKSGFSCTSGIIFTQDDLPVVSSIAELNDIISTSEG